MSDGRELLGHGAAGGLIRLLGNDQRHGQYSLELVSPTHWRPIDEREFQIFEEAL